MADIKTKPTKVSPAAFIKTVEDDRKRRDCRELVAMMKELTGYPATMWGPSIIGFGAYHYKYASGREGDMPLTGFSPRKDSLTLYLGPSLQDGRLLGRLGKHKTVKGCLYIKTLDDIDRDVLRDLITASVEETRERHTP